MFIIKFNKMIRNKWVWGAFAFLVVILFMSEKVGGPTPNDPHGIGTLGGKHVTQTDYRYVQRAVQFDNERTPNSIPNTELEIWKRLAVLAAAEKSGISVPDKVLIDILKSDPTFHNENGDFDSMRYQAILEFHKYKTKEFEELQRRQMVISRMEQSVASSAFLSPAVIDNRVKGYTDSFVIRTAILTNSHTEESVALTEEDVRKYFDGHGEMWREPERRSVVYAEFKMLDYINEVPVSEDEITEYYEINSEKYIVAGADGESTLAPLEEVREMIETELASVAAREKAHRTAADFANVFYEFYSVRNQRKTITFEQAAADFGANVVTSRPFATSGSPVIASAAPAFVEAAFTLRPEGAARFSDAVDGGDIAYVIGWHDVVESRIPDFESVRLIVGPRAVQAKIAELFYADADVMSKAFLTSREAGMKFDEIAAAQGIECSTNFPFSYADAFSDYTIPGAREVAETMTHMEAGEFTTDSVLTPGAAVFFEVIERKSGDPMSIQSAKRFLTSGFQQDLAKILLEDWREKNFKSLNPQPRFPFRNNDDDFHDYDDL